MAPVRLNHTFVVEIPQRLRPDTCYISTRYATAAHLCPCGCGHEVNTPISPTDWTLTFDGETVSLHPSISNRLCPRRSHYWIKRNHIQWAPPQLYRPRRSLQQTVNRITRSLRRLIP